MEVVAVAESAARAPLPAGLVKQGQVVGRGGGCEADRVTSVKTSDAATAERMRVLTASGGSRTRVSKSRSTVATAP